MDKGKMTTIISDLGLLIVAGCTLVGIELDPNIATALASALILIIIAYLDLVHPEYKDKLDDLTDNEDDEEDGQE